MNLLVKTLLSNAFAATMAVLVVSYPEPQDVLAAMEPGWDAPDLIAAANAGEFAFTPSNNTIRPVIQDHISVTALVERLRNCASDIDTFTPEHLMNCYALYERAQIAASDLVGDREFERVAELDSVVRLFQAQVCIYAWSEFSKPGDEPPPCITTGVAL